MWKAEEDFPRGGTKVYRAFNKDDNENSFENGQKIQVVLNLVLEKPPKLISRKRKLADFTSPEKPKLSKRPKRDIHQLVDVPLRQDLATDICVLACVRQTHDYSVSMSLPGNVVGTLSITDISASYSQLLQSLAHSEDPDKSEEVKSTDELFKKGMLLPVVITEITNDKQRNKNFIKLSIVPSVINANVPLKAIENGMLVFGSVSSIEDHGYKVDLGIKGLQAFLTTNDASSFIQKHNQGSPLCVGYPLWCVLKMKDSSAFKAGESRAVNVTIDPDIVQQAKVKETSNLYSVVPGMNVTGRVQSITDSGLHVTVFSFKGMVHSSQLPRAGSQYQVGEEIQLRILYIHPVTKMIHLSALPELIQFNGSPLQLFGDLNIGSIIEGTVIFVAKKKGVYFKLPGNVKGFATVKQLSDQENPDISKFEKGMICQCRVLSFNFMECVALVTLKQSILQQKFLSIQEISPGDVIRGTIKEVLPNGVVVKLSKGIYSFISCLHLADVPIKHPEKKFEAGKEIKCRVLKVDLTHSKVMLTHKQSLLKSKYPLVTDYSQLRPNMELEGYIVAVKDTVVIVSFFNDVKGVVRLKDMGMEKVDSPSTMFYIGQVVRCRVVSYNVDDKKLRVSFNFGTKKPKDVEEASVDVVSDFKLGKEVEATVLKVEKDCFKVYLQPSKAVAILQFCHLSDFHEIQELRKLVIKPGQKLDKVIYFNQKQKAIVTMKESFIQAAKDNSLVEHFEDLKIGTLMPAVIKNHQDYGMFLELAGGHTGLCPAKTLTYLQPSNLQELFRPGQTVMTRITKIDSEKKRFLGSARLDDCHVGGIETPLSLLTTYLSAREQVHKQLFAEKDELAMYEGLHVGSIVEVTVSSSLKKGILGDLPSGAKALATKVNLGGMEPAVGSKHKAAVLYIDLLTPCVELSLDQKLVKAIDSRKENKKTQVKSGQILKADVLLVKPEFMLMCLRGHGTGKCVYVPVRQHINDVEIDRPYEPGTFTEVVVKDSFGDYSLAVLKSQDPEVMAKENAKKINLKTLPKHNIKPGMVIDAKIRNVHPLQLNIVVNDLHGRVHITEAADSVEEGESPLQKYRQDKMVKVKVLALRDLKSQSYLPITHPKSNRALLECTLKESKISSETDADLFTPKLALQPDDKVVAYVIKISSNKVWFQVSLKQQGYIDFFHLSINADVLNNVSSHFKTGQAYQVTVLESDNDDKLVLSRIDGGIKVTVGEPVTALITSMKPGVALYVKLPGGRLGVVNTPPTMLHYVGQYIRCQVQEIENLDRCILTLLDQSQVPVVKARKRKHETSLVETEAKAEKNIIKMKKVLKMERKKKTLADVEEQGDNGDLSDSDKEGGKTIELVSAIYGCGAKKGTQVPRLSVQGFSWEGDLTAKIDDDKVDSDNDNDDGDNI
ncbi:unnamed protein product, partial [Candidula unifasciata]